ncbi:MAG: GntR family transcriptional regulator [Lachnospiraceae bacterium]|nr:GntR family transcriptional regulator [Lachnospiraceae bacterium]
MPIKNLLKHRRISQWIINSINNGHFKPGDKLPSEHSLAEQFDTSRQTVRHATEELVQRGLLTRQRGSGTYVSGTAFQTGFSPKRIGVITTYVDDYIFPGIIRGIEDALTSQGYSISLGITHNRHTDETACLQRILDDNVCGLIVEGTKSSFPSPNLPLFEELRSRGTPMVFLNGYYREFSQCGVFQDDVTAAKLLTEHLLKNGHRKFAAIFKADDLQGLKRFEGMSLALTEADIPIDDQRILWFTTEDIPDLFSGEMDSFTLKRFGDSTALICYNDQIAASVCELLKRNGKSIPKDISLVSFDNSPLAADMAYGFTSVNYPAVEIGNAAAKLLLRCIRDNTLREHIRFAPNICYRSSVRNLAEEAENIL